MWQDYDVKRVDSQNVKTHRVTVNIVVTNHTKTTIRDLEFNLSNNEGVEFCPEEDETAPKVSKTIELLKALPITHVES